MPNPYEVDDQGRPVAEAESATGANPAAEALIRRQIDRTLRVMALATLLGLMVIVVIAVLVPEVRGLMVLVGIVYVVSSLAARWYLRRRVLSGFIGSGAGSD